MNLETLVGYWSPEGAREDKMSEISGWDYRRATAIFDAMPKTRLLRSTYGWIASMLSHAGEPSKDPRFSAAMERADAIVIVSPEYNHSFPGLLKHVLDSCLKEELIMRKRTVA